MVCLVGMEGSRDVEPLREVQRMSWRLAINSIGSRSTGSGEGDPERWGEGKSKQRKRREWKRGGITGRDMRRRWRGVKGHTVIAHLNACNYSKQACKTNEGWNSTLINCILGLCCSHHFWLCRSGYLAAAGIPPHSCRCRSPQCLCTSDCTSRTHCTHWNLQEKSHYALQFLFIGCALIQHF